LMWHYGRWNPYQYTLPYDQLYGPLWSLLLGFLTLPFRFLADQGLLRHAFTFALLPLGLLTLLRLLLRAGLDLALGLLCLAMIFGVVRFSGHALVNVKDFPHAMAFLIVSVFMWVRLREICSSQNTPTTRQVLPIVCASLVPFLLRTPLLFHFVGLWGFLLLFILLSRQKFSLRQVCSLLGLPWLILIAAAVLFFPVIWQAGPKPWVHMFIFFNNVYTDGTVRIFGVDYPSQALPRWYSLVWIPIITNPLALVAGIIGLCSLPWRSLPIHKFSLDTRLGQISVSLKFWLTLILVAAWSTVIIKSPRLYDEERHVLFLYPLLALLAGLGLHWLPKTAKYGLASLISAWTLGALLLWGPYSYIYKSPLLGKRNASAFMGDYWGICLNSLLPKLPKILPDLSKEIEIPMAMGVARLQQQRLLQSNVFGVTNFPHLNLADQAKGISYYYILVQRQPYIRLKQLEGKVELKEIYSQTMPPNDEAACVVYEAKRL
jgi:hypothetical protein